MAGFDIWAGVDAATLEGYLTAARAAYVRLQSGEAVVEVEYDGRRVRYDASKGSRQELERYIAGLQAAIARRKPRGAVTIAHFGG